MNAKILCNWLDIKDWPPDHYALLGLKQGEKDLASIEHQVQERMAKLRCYQLCHPDEATEGMNRVAQAFITLTEAISRPPCSAPGRPASVTAERPAALIETQRLLVSGSKTEIDWSSTPPPVRVAAVSDSRVGVVAEPPVEKQLSPPPAALTQARSIDAVYGLAHECPEARRGLGTLPALIERINLTRKLICSWKQVGKYLSSAGEN